MASQPIFCLSVSSDAVCIKLLKCHIRCRCHGEILKKKTSCTKSRKSQSACRTTRLCRGKGWTKAQFKCQVLCIPCAEEIYKYIQKTSVNASEPLPLLESVVSNVNGVVHVSSVPTTGSNGQRLRHLASTGSNRKQTKLPKSLRGGRQPANVNTGRRSVSGHKLHV